MMAADNSNVPRSSRSDFWQDWANLVLAIWLFISPWVLRFGTMTTGTASGVDTGHASWNAWVLGVVIFLVALSAIAQMRVWQEWVNGALAIWVFIAPWVLGFQHAPAAAWDHWIVGVLVFLVSLSMLSLTGTPTGRAHDIAHAHR